MLKYGFIFTIIFVTLLANTAFASERIGVIAEIEGNVTITSKNGQTKIAQIDEALFLGDIVTTGKNSRAFIFLVDNTEFTLSENAKFKVDEYNYSPNSIDTNKARYSVIEGAFRYVSGLVAKKDSPDIKIETPFGSIGIRGTDFTVAKATGGGYDILLDDGEIKVANEKGSTILKPGYGTSVKSRRHMPTLAKRWNKSKIQRLRKAVHLKRGKAIRARLENIRKQRKDNFIKRNKERIKNNLNKKLKNKEMLKQRGKPLPQKMNKINRQGQKQGSFKPTNISPHKAKISNKPRKVKKPKVIRRNRR